MVKNILGFQERYNDTDPEEEWFGKRVIVWPGAKIAHGDDEKRFSVEDVWHPAPLGYHIRDSGTNLADEVWKDPVMRKGNFNYCPELSIIMDMKLDKERCPGDNKEGEIMEMDQLREFEAKKAKLAEVKAQMEKTKENVKNANEAAVEAAKVRSSPYRICKEPKGFEDDMRAERKPIYILHIRCKCTFQNGSQILCALLKSRKSTY